MELLTRTELAEVLKVSTRTIDRLRAAGYELGEFRSYPGACPRFNSEKVREAIKASGFRKARARLNRVDM
jgi:hypothetical protein